MEYVNGQTPLEEEEKEGLLVSTITTHGELNEFEQQNIEKAIEWTLGRKFNKEKIISENFVRELHGKMFGDVWNWAGKFRRTNKNLGCDLKRVSAELKKLNDDCRYWLGNKIYPEEEIAIRYKHRAVSIRCFSNGNGQHSRLMGDIIVNHIFGKKVFTWGGANLNKTGELRNNYLNAIRKADKGDLLPLIEFAKT